MRIHRSPHETAEETEQRSVLPPSPGFAQRQVEGQRSCWCQEARDTVSVCLFLATRLCTQTPSFSHLVRPLCGGRGARGGAGALRSQRRDGGPSRSLLPAMAPLPPAMGTVPGSCAGCPTAAIPAAGASHGHHRFSSYVPAVCRFLEWTRQDAAEARARSEPESWAALCQLRPGEIHARSPACTRPGSALLGSAQPSCLACVRGRAGVRGRE